MGDYALREAAAERILDRKVESWRAESDIAKYAKAVAIFGSLLGTAAIMGFVTGGGACKPVGLVPACVSFRLTRRG